MRTWKLPKLDPFTILCLLLTLFILVSTVFLATKNAFIADDFIQYPAKNVITEHVYLRDSGRISHGIVMQLLYGVFDSRAINIMPILVVVSLFFVLTHLGYTLTKKRRESFWIGSILASVFLATMPSFFDFSLFFSAACVHSVSFIIIIFASSLVIDRYITHARKKGYAQLIAIYTLSIFLSLLSELSSIIMCGILIALAISMRDIKRIIKLAPLALIQLVGFVIIYTSPGSTGRRADASTGQSLLEIIQGSLRDTLHISQLPLANIFVVIASLVLATILINHINPKNKLRYALFGLLFISIPLVITVTTNASLGYTSLRMQNIAMFSMIILMIIFWLLLLKIRSVYAIANRLLPYLRIVLPILLTIVFTITVHMPISYALDSRNNQLERRESLIEQSRESGTIDFLPAPLLLKDTEAIDIGFYPEESPNSRWLYSALLGYYNIRDFDINLLEQPDQYCINVDIYNRFKEIDAKKCESY